MAKPKELARLIPKSIEVELEEGKTVLVPGDKEENAIMYRIVASKLRDLLERTVKKYDDSDARLSPKDLRDLAEAGRIMSEFSGKVYESVIGPPKDPEKKVEQVINVEDFGALNKKKDGE